MALIYKEASFPIYYREAEVRQIMGAVYRLRSIAITGLAGMGKSNVVRFIVSHPQVRPRYLKERANDYAFVHVDCAGLVEVDEAEILSEIAAQLRHDGISAGGAHLPQASRSVRHIPDDPLAFGSGFVSGYESQRVADWRHGMASEYLRGRRMGAVVRRGELPMPKCVQLASGPLPGYLWQIQRNWPGCIGSYTHGPNNRYRAIAFDA